MAEWSIAPDCKSGGRWPTQVRILPYPNDQKNRVKIRCSVRNHRAKDGHLFRKKRGPETLEASRIFQALKIQSGSEE